MNRQSPQAARILILESDRKTCAALRRYAVKGWAGASVQTNTATLADVVHEGAALVGFDVVLAACDFSHDGTRAHGTLEAVRAVAADPANPPVVLLTRGGSEYTAVQAVKAGAFDCIPRQLLGREQVVSAVQRALESRPRADEPGNLAGVVRLFGYDVRRCLARHDNVSVHVAYSAEHGKEVVLKVLHRGKSALSKDGNFARFVEEFKLLYDLEDPAVAEIYDFRVTSRYCAIAMEYFRSGHLGQRLMRALDPDDALSISAEIAKALSIIHAAGIVHRDLKPANVMLREDGSLALIDFGIAQSTTLEETLNGRTGVIAGTPYYMSPEQARGEPTDERTDLYALGVILFHMLTGDKPYVGDTAEEILDKHCTAPIPALPARLQRLQPLIDRLLAKSPAQRIPSAREAIEAFEAVRSPADLEAPYPLSATSA